MSDSGKIPEDQTLGKINFRGSNGYCLSLFDTEDRLIYTGTTENDIYFNGFYYGWMKSQGCFSCRYASSNRVGVITLGDFWGLGQCTEKQLSLKNGVSLVMINTPKGERLFDSADCIREKRTLAEAVRGNSALRIYERRILLTRYFYLNMKYGYRSAVEKCRFPMKLLLLLKNCKKVIKKVLENIV